MAWRGDSWADVVRRAATRGHRKPKPLPERRRESPAELAARAEIVRYIPDQARVAIHGRTITIGADITAYDVELTDLYHVEPVDPWPSLALGWIYFGEPYRTVLTPHPSQAEELARAVEEVVSVCEGRVPDVTSRGWLAAPVREWEPVDAMPGEDQQPAIDGYRTAPAQPDPIIATRKPSEPHGLLLTWLWKRLRGQGSRWIEPREVTLTKRFVYARARDGRVLRMPIDLLRTSRRTQSGDTVYVFARNTELFLPYRSGCELTAALDARL